MESLVIAASWRCRRGKPATSDRAACWWQKADSFRSEVRWRWSGELRGRIAKAVVVEAGRGAERTGDRSEGNRRQRSSWFISGLRFYQSSFGSTGKLDGLKVAITPESGAVQSCNLHPLAMPFNQPVQLDANTTVTLAEYIPDFFVRDNQIFKRSDDPGKPRVPSASEKRCDRRRREALDVPRLQRRCARPRRPRYKLRFSRHGHGLLHRPGSVA